MATQQSYRPLHTVLLLTPQHAISNYCRTHCNTSLTGSGHHTTHTLHALRVTVHVGMTTVNMLSQQIFQLQLLQIWLLVKLRQQNVQFFEVLYNYVNITVIPTGHSYNSLGILHTCTLINNM